MSKAFTKEDAEIPERAGRTRSRSGLPPGALNYITSEGARRLKEELAVLRRSGGGEERLGELERTLATATIVEPPEEAPEGIAFGANVTLRDANGVESVLRIVGVEEVDFAPGSVSWVSETGRILLQAYLGDRLRLEGQANPVTVEKIEY